MAEREAAAALLAGDTSKGGKAHGRAIVSTDERGTMRRWGWFIAVWGQKPATVSSPRAKKTTKRRRRGRQRARTLVGPLAGRRDPQTRGLDRDQERARGGGGRG
jgi:hypothetical protein